MDYPETKVYFDGSHYIAIPHTTRFAKKRKVHVEEEITVVQDEQQRIVPVETKDTTNDVKGGEIDTLSSETVTVISGVTQAKETQKTEHVVKKTTRKDLFEEFYEATKDMPSGMRRLELIAKMIPFFKSEDFATKYVDKQLERKLKNLIAKKTRLQRKLNINEFNYFCTFTYDSEKIDEMQFKKKLKDCFRNLSFRNNWKYIGVWELSPEKQRLHFHGLFYIPPGSMPGEMIEVKDYNTVKHEMQTTWQNSYFLKRFGRNDFRPVDTKDEAREAIKYIVKYLEKTGEKIVYSRGLYQFFISDVIDEDVVCKTGMEDKKLILFDDFICWDQGEYMGTVSQEIIAKMRKSN